MKIKNLLITLCMAILSLCVMVAGCKSTPPTLTLDNTSLSLMEGESKVLEAVVEDFDGELSWSSSSTEIATVDQNGKVIGVKAGNAKITVSADDVTATCSVTVKKDESFPVIKVEHEQVDLYVGSTFVINAQITRNNKPFSSQLLFASSDPNVATVSNTGVITAVANGTALVSVSTQFDGHIIEKTVIVNVNYDLDVSFNESLIKLATGEVLENGNVGEKQIEISISEKGNALTSKEVTWRIENDQIATLSGQGYSVVVSAENAGTTNLVAMFEHQGKTIEYFATVECFVPYYQLSEEIYVDQSKVGDQTSVEVEIEGVNLSEITSLTLNDKQVDYVKGENGIIFQLADIPMKESQLKFESAKTGYTASVICVTQVLSSKEDVLEFAKLYSEYKTGKYFVLSNDIDMEGTNVTTAPGSTWNIGVTGWASTFDGRGHALKNISYTHGLFPNFTGTLQNIAIINAKKAVNGGGLISNELNGALNNVFISGTIESGSLASQGGIANACYSAASITNCVVMPEYTVSGYNALFGNAASAVNQSVKNVIVISKTASDLIYTKTLTNAKNVKLYSSVVEFLADSEFDKSPFGGVWSDTEYLPLMDSVKATIDFSAKITTNVEMITNGDKITADKTTAEFKLKAPVDGISISGAGVVTIDKAVPANTEFIVQACIFGRSVDQKTFRTLKSVETNAIYNVDLSKEFEIDLSEIEENFDANSVSKVIIEGVEPSFTISGSKLIVDGKAITNATAGMNKLATISMNDGIAYKIKVNVAQMVLGSKEDVLEFAKVYNIIASNPNALVILAKDVDMEGTNVTTAQGSTWTIATSWNATFDGLGNSISNIAYTHGFFPLMLKGTLRNLAIVGAKKAVNGGGLISNEFNGTIENLFVLGTIESGSLEAQGGLVGAARANAVVTNCVVMPTYTNGGLNALFGNAVSATTAYATNVIVISNATSLCEGKELVNLTNTKLYSSVSEFLADTEFDKSGFTGVWTSTEGLPLMNGVKPTGSITTSTERVMSGEKITSDNPMAEFKLASAVEGISISADGLLTIDSSVPANTEFKVIATVFGTKIAEKTFKVDLAVDKTSIAFDFGYNNAKNVIDLSKLSDTLTANDVLGFSIDGIGNVEFTVSGDDIAVSGSSLGTNATQSIVNVVITTNEAKYLTTLNVQAMFINDKQDLIDFYAKQYNNKAGETYVLTADIDMAGTSLVNATVSENRMGSETTYAWKATFDGQGHVISNTSFYAGFLPQINGGVVKNLGLVNVTDTYNDYSMAKQVGLIARFIFNEGLVENVYVKATNVQESRLTGIAARTRQDASTIRNCVVVLENATGVTGGGVVVASNLNQSGKVENVFGVSDTRTDLGKNVSTETNKLYTSVAELNTAGVAATTLATEGSVWNVVGGSLYFGSTIVG